SQHRFFLKGSGYSFTYMHERLAVVTRFLAIVISCRKPRAFSGRPKLASLKFGQEAKALYALAFGIRVERHFPWAAGICGAPGNRLVADGSSGTVYRSGSRGLRGNRSWAEASAGLSGRRATSGAHSVFSLGKFGNHLCGSHPRFGHRRVFD